MHFRMPEFKYAFCKFNSTEFAKRETKYALLLQKTKLQKTWVISSFDKVFYFSVFSAEFKSDFLIIISLYHRNVRLEILLKLKEQLLLSKKQFPLAAIMFQNMIQASHALFVKRKTFFFWAVSFSEISTYCR